MARMNHEARRREDLLRQPTCDELHAQLLAEAESSSGKGTSATGHGRVQAELDIPSLTMLLTRQPERTTLSLTATDEPSHRIHIHRRSRSDWQVSAQGVPASVADTLPNRDANSHSTIPMSATPDMVARNCNVLAADLQHTTWALSSRI